MKRRRRGTRGAAVAASALTMATACSSPPAGEGTLYASEFGQNTWDELNVITAGDNYGWPEGEGIAVSGEFVFIANLRRERLRDVVSAPDGSLRVLTNNTDGRDSPGPDDDRILRVDLGG